MVETLVRSCRCARHDLDLTFDFAVVTSTYKILSRLYLLYRKCKKLILVRDIGWGCTMSTSWCTTSWCDLDLTLDLAVVTFTYNIVSGLYLGNRNV